MNFIFKTYLPDCCLVSKALKITFSKACVFLWRDKCTDDFKQLSISNSYHLTDPLRTKGSIL